MYVESDASLSRASLVLVSLDLSRFLIVLVRGYKYHPLHVISYPLDQIRADLSYVKEPEVVLDRQDRVMRNKTIPFSRFFGGTIPSGKPLRKLRSLSGLLILISFHDL
nr:putative reverse transcriptase domain-containing protein [Tanacetum cinerariifolium]